MNLSKTFLLGIVVVLAIQPFPLSAMINVDELTEKIRTVQTSSKTMSKTPVVEQEWASYLRKCTGKGLRNLGDFLRTPEYKSATGQAKKMAENMLSKAFQEKTGIPISGYTILNYFGNGLRTLGQKVKGGQPHQTTTRVILDSLSLNKHSSEIQIRQALRTVAQATFKAKESTALGDYKLVVEGMVKRAYATMTQIDAINPNALYVEALAEEKLRTHVIPLTGAQPVPVKKPLVETQPVAVKKPLVETQPVAVKKPLVETQPVAVKKTVVETQPVAVKKPLVETQPVKTKKPLTAQGPAVIKKPLTRQPQSAIKRPLTKQRLSPIKRPLAKRRPSATKRPLAKQRLSPIKRPLAKQRLSPIKRPLAKQRLSPIKRPLAKRRPSAKK